MSSLKNLRIINTIQDIPIQKLPRKLPGEKKAFTTKIINLSKYKLSRIQISLRKGAKFTPTTLGYKIDLNRGLIFLTRKLQIKEIYNNDDSFVSKKSTKKLTTKNTDLTNVVNEIEELDS